jgi:hypothetical protein
MIVDAGVEFAFVVVSSADIPASVLEPLIEPIDSLDPSDQTSNQHGIRNLR